MIIIIKQDEAFSSLLFYLKHLRNLVCRERKKKENNPQKHLQNLVCRGRKKKENNPHQILFNRSFA